MLSPRGQSGLLLSSYLVGHFSCQSRVKFVNLVFSSGNNLKTYVVNFWSVLYYCFIIIFGLGLDLMVLAPASALALKLWPRPRRRSFGLGIEALTTASASTSRFWPWLTSLVVTRRAYSASPDPVANWSIRQTVMGRHVAAKEQKYHRCRNYWPMYSAVMWRQFSLAGGHDEQ